AGGRRQAGGGPATGRRRAGDGLVGQQPATGRSGGVGLARRRACKTSSMSDPRRDSQSIFTRGAVDLSAFQRPPAANPAGRPAGNPPGNGSGNPAGPAGRGGNGGASAGAAQPPARSGNGSGMVMVDVTEATFQAEVLERSLTTPVVVDLWAEWCGPCKQLSPLLEKLAMEYRGAFVLAKIDVDANPRLAQMFRVQSIPMVYAVVGGQPIDAFTGVVPEAQLRQWLDAVLKAAGVEVPAAEDPRLAEADQALLAGDLDAAERAYQKILAESPADAAA